MKAKMFRLLLCLVCASLGATTLAVNAEVRVGVPGTEFPTPVPIPQRPISVKFEGNIHQAQYPLPSAWTIAGLDVIVTTDTLILPPEHSPQPGEYAVVSAIQENDLLTAKRINIRPGTKRDWQFVEFRSTVLSFPEAPYAGEWVIGDRIIVVSSTTLIAGIPSVGHYAQIMGWVDASGRIDAAHLAMLDPSIESSRFEFKGEIQELGDGESGIWVIGNVAGQIEETTLFTGGPPRQNAIAEVRGRCSGETLVFEEIKVLDDVDREICLRGTIDEINVTEGSLVIAGTRVLMDELTFLDERRVRAMPGMWAEVIAQQWGKYLYALRIRVDRPE